MEPNNQRQVPSAGITPEERLRLDQISTVVDRDKYSPEITEEERLRLDQISTTTGPTAEEINNARIAGGASGLLEYLPSTGGAILGAARFAPLVAPLLGPAAPVAGLIGGAAGMYSGLLAGKKLSELLIDNPEEDVLRDFESAKTFTSAIATAPLAFYIPSGLSGRLGPYISAIGETARKYPKSFLLGETTAAASSAGGAYLALTEDPNDPFKRLVYETVGGAIDPLRLIPNLTMNGGRKLRQLWQARTRGGRQALAAAAEESARDKATRRIMEILEEQGEDIPALIKALEEPLPGSPVVSYPPGGQRGQVTGPTAAQKTGSIALAQLEAALSTLDPNFGAEITEQGRQSLRALSGVVQRLQDAGSPEALRVAAEMRQEFFDNAINNRLERAMERAAERIKKISPDLGNTASARTQVGQIVREETEQALENARSAERFYWERAVEEARKPGGMVRLQVQPSDTLINESYLNWAKDLLPELKRMRSNDVDFRNPAAVSRVTKMKAVPLSVFIKDTGGIANDSELLARDITNKSLPGLVRQNIPRNVLGERGTASIDAVKERVFDAGYFPSKGDYNEISDSELYDAIARDLFSDERVWTMKVRAALDPFINEREVLDSWAAEGFDPTMTLQQVANRARVLDDLTRKEGREGFYLSSQSLPGPKEKLVPRPRQALPQSTVNAYLERASEIGPALINSRIPGPVRDIMESFGVTEQAIKNYRENRSLPDKKLLEKVKPIDLINYRSQLLSMARVERAAGDVSDASFYSLLAQSMLDDLSTLKNPAYDKAREFSNALNDTFTRTFANDLLGTTKTGANRYPVETLVDDAFGVGADLTALRMKEIENAIAFMRDRLTKAAAEAKPVIPGDTRFQAEAQMLNDLSKVSTQGVASIQDAHNRVLRLLASKATFLDPKTNSLRLNTRQLNKFVNEYKPLLDQLGITGDLTNAAQAENVLRAVLEQNSALNTTVRNQMAFSQILAFENPTNAIASAMRSRFPRRRMARLARFAQRNGPEAMEGLKSSLYDYVFTKASGGTEVIDPEKFKDAFFKPLGKDMPTLSDIMRTQGIMSPQELTNLRRLANQMMVVEDAMANKVAIESVVQGADAMTELVMRVVGSKIGTAASGGGPGSLIAASAGSKAIRQIFDKMPMVMVRHMIQRAAQDPALMAQLLRRNLSEREKFRLAKSLHAYMLASGLNYATYEEPPEAKVAAQGPRASDQLQNLEDVYNRLRGRPQPPAPTTRGVPGLPPAPTTPPTGGVPGGAPPTAGGPTQSRAMLQQLFPNDAVLGAAAMAQNPMMQPPQGMG